MDEFKIGVQVTMKKGHPCGTNKWVILRYGADVKLQCLECSRIIMIDRPKFLKQVKKRLES
ncbi:MAG: DUF951 domain-containing protein [Acholeplasmatales bacterium]|nr:MAG: DUF951 domain-containing protein [Acholeplasmatales bacterium]